MKKIILIILSFLCFAFATLMFLVQYNFAFKHNAAEIAPGLLLFILIGIGFIKLAFGKYLVNDNFNNIIPSFGKRLSANLLDAIFISPVSGIFWYLETKSVINGLIFHYLYLFIFCFYEIYFTGKFGKTPGKMIMKIKVIKITNLKINYKDAFLRSLWNIVFSVIILIGTTYAFMRISNSEYINLKWTEQSLLLTKNDLFPFWFISLLNILFLTGEILTLIFNKKKRAIHDFIAKTIVIEDKKSTIEQLQSVL
jgi:uncharacterized RDD family membrane protein YckC